MKAEPKQIDQEKEQLMQRYKWLQESINAICAKQAYTGRRAKQNLETQDVAARTEPAGSDSKQGAPKKHFLRTAGTPR